MVCPTGPVGAVAETTGLGVFADVHDDTAATAIDPNEPARKLRRDIDGVPMWTTLTGAP
jgi:hypothetical protein